MSNFFVIFVETKRRQTIFEVNDENLMNDLNEIITEDSQASLIRIVWFPRKSSGLIKRPDYGNMLFLSIEILVL